MGEVTLPVRQRVYKAPSTDQTTNDFLPNGMPVWGRDSEGRPICNTLRNGKNAAPGTRCQQWRDLSPVNGRCRMHGGKSVSGVDHPRYKGTGERSSLYRGAMLNQDEWEDFQKLWRAKGLTSLREDIAYTNLELQRLADELGKITPADLKKLRSGISQIEKVLGEYDESVDDIRQAVAAHRQTLEDLISFRSVSQQIEAKQKHKRELVETENRKIIAGTKSITADRFLALALNWAESIIRHVTDRRERNALLDDLDRSVGINVPVMGMPPGQEVLQALPEGEEDDP